MHYVLSITVAVVALCTVVMHTIVFTRVEIFYTQTISIVLHTMLLI